MPYGIRYAAEIDTKFQSHWAIKVKYSQYEGVFGCEISLILYLGAIWEQTIDHLTE
jgi:hypothetical protein